MKGEAIGNQEKKIHMQKRAHRKVSDEMHSERKGTKTLKFSRTLASARSQRFCGINRHQVLGLNMNLRIRWVLR